MKFPGVFLFALVIGVMAAVLCVIDMFLSPVIGPAENKGFVWVSFIAWAIYFLAGGNVIGGVKATIGYAIGITASIGIIQLVGPLNGILPASVVPYATPLAVLVIAPLLICLENVPYCNFIPAMFVASGTYFGIVTYVYGSVDCSSLCGAFGVEMCYALLGFVFGWLSLQFRAPIQNRFAKE